MSGINYGDRILSDLHKTLEVAVKYGETEDANVEKYTEMAKTVCKIEHGFLLGQDIIKEAAKQPSVETFEQYLEGHRNESHPKFKPQSSIRYTNFVKKAHRLVDIETTNTSQSTVDMSMEIDEVSQSSQVITDIDPITKQKLERPVRNKHCKHIYGYESVLQSVQLNPRLRCPIMGCPNNKYITMTDLIEDEETAIRLARQRKSKY